MALTLSTLIPLALFAFIIVYDRLQKLNRPPLPPGPKGLPFLGAAKEHPRTEFWKTYREWGLQYGIIPPSLSLTALSNMPSRTQATKASSHSTSSAGA